ncbi:MAG: DUF2065 domain-containing protein [Alphaproteobacteria bacterium]|nr:DUF2065 domain-containing protein [Alphaproteobacteria bacterium]
MVEIGTALALVLVIEGVLYALFPDAMRRMMEAVLVQPAATLRMAGVFAVALGVGMVWVLRG